MNRSVTLCLLLSVNPFGSSPTGGMVSSRCSGCRRKGCRLFPSVIGEFSKILSRNIEKMGNFYAACSNTSRVTIHRDNATELKVSRMTCSILSLLLRPMGTAVRPLPMANTAASRFSGSALGISPKKEILGIDRSLMGGKIQERLCFPPPQPNAARFAGTNFRH